MVLSPTACIWFLPVVLALLPGAQPVSESWLQPLDNWPLLDLSPSWGLTMPHPFLVPCLSTFGFCPQGLMLLLPRGAPASVDGGCQSPPLQTPQLVWIVHPADSELPGTFLHPPGSASILATLLEVCSPGLDPFSVPRG